jgi:hypothetical protein
MMTYDPGATATPLSQPSEWLHHLTRAQDELERARSAPSCCARRPHLELAQLHIQRLVAGPDHSLDGRGQNYLRSVS